MTGTSVIYPCGTDAEARRAVASTLFQSMLWLFWYEIADRLRYVGITAGGISRALDGLVEDGAAERMTAGDGRLIWRAVL